MKTKCSVFDRLLPNTHLWENSVVIDLRFYFWETLKLQLGYILNLYGPGMKDSTLSLFMGGGGVYHSVCRGALCNYLPKIIL